MAVDPKTSQSVVSLPEDASYHEAASAEPPGPELCVVIPTFNERESVPLLVDRLRTVLGETRWEAIFVDDNSPDGTAEVVNELARSDARIRAIRRIGRRGLSSAVVEGMLATSAPFVAVIDADLQHDETLLPKMLARMNAGDCDLVVASRTDTAPGGMTPLRKRISEWSNRLARRAIHSDVQDIMSGFFMVRREIVEETAGSLSQMGFKILADILASSPRPLRVVEEHYRFRPRVAGESKLDAQAASAFILLLIDKRVGHWIPARFLAFAAVGSIGVAVHLATLGLLLRGAGIAFGISQAIATLVAITSNYSLNNAFTYRDLRLKGADWLRGWVSFFLVSIVGAVGNVGVASALYDNNIANWPLAGIAGIAIGTVWNFGMTRAYTWNDR